MYNSLVQVQQYTFSTLTICIGENRQWTLMSNSIKSFVHDPVTSNSEASTSTSAVMMFVAGSKRQTTLY